MKVALRSLLAATRARLSLALLRASVWLDSGTSDDPPVITPPPDPITPEAKELLVEDPPPRLEVVLPEGEVIRRVVRSPRG